jgi:hypothetical protein
MMNMLKLRHFCESVEVFRDKNQMSSIRAWLSWSFILRTAEAAVLARFIVSRHQNEASKVDVGTRNISQT